MWENQPLQLLACFYHEMVQIYASREQIGLFFQEIFKAGDVCGCIVIIHFIQQLHFLTPVSPGFSRFHRRGQYHKL